MIYSMHIHRPAEPEDEIYLKAGNAAITLFREKKHTTFHSNADTD